MLPQPINCGQEIDLKEIVNGIRIELFGHERKFLKLLTKQYEIDSISRDEPEMESSRIIRMKPLVIVYFNPLYPRRKFTWQTVNYTESEI